MSQETQLTGPYVRNHALPAVAEPDSYDAMRAAVNNLIESAADWLDANGPAEYLRLGTVALRSYEHCCIEKRFTASFSILTDPPDGLRGPHIPCLRIEERSPTLPLTGRYVRAHALPLEPDRVSYDELREAVNGMLHDVADWLDVNGPVLFLHVGSLVLKADGDCCVGIRYDLNLRPLEAFPAAGDDGHIPCINGGEGE